MNLELQRKLLSDTLRNTQFHRALKNLVCKDDVVIDLGAGTGFLGLVALQLGARKVIFIEENPILELAVTLAGRLGVSDRCEFHQCHSSALTTELTLSQKADLLICETLGSYPFEEFILESIQDGRKFLKPRGRLIPSDLTVWLTPVCTPVVQKRVDSWTHLSDHLPCPLPWDDVRAIALSRMYVELIPHAACLKPAQRLHHFPFTQDPPALKWSSTVHWNATRSVKVYGFCLFWESALDKGIQLSTSPWKPLTHWQQIYLPLLEPTPLPKQHRLEVTVSSECRRDSGVQVRWEGHVRSTRRDEVHTFKMDTDHGRVGYW